MSEVGLLTRLDCMLDARFTKLQRSIDEAAGIALAIKEVKSFVHEVELILDLEKLALLEAETSLEDSFKIKLQANIDTLNLILKLLT